MAAGSKYNGLVGIRLSGHHPNGNNPAIGIRVTQDKPEMRPSGVVCEVETAARLNEVQSVFAGQLLHSRVSL